MHADVLQKRMQMAAQDTLENNKGGSWRLKAEPCLAAKRTLFTVRSKYWWNDGAKCYEVSKVIITQPEADINVLVTSFQDHRCREVPVHIRWYLPCEPTAYWIASSGKHHFLHENAVLMVEIFQDQSKHLMFSLILARLTDCYIYRHPTSNKCCNAVTDPSSGTPQSG